LHHDQPNFSGKKLAVLGTGNLAAFSSRLPEAKTVRPEKRRRTSATDEKAVALAKELGVASSTDNRKAVRGADIVPARSETASRWRSAEGNQAGAQ